MQKELDGKVAIVTGAAGGLGAAICEVFAREGASVVAVDRQGEGCFRADVGTRAGNEEMVAEAVRRHGQVDILALNAGFQFMAPIYEFPEEQWDALQNVMVKGPAMAIRAAWPQLTREPGGRIIATGSSLSLVAEEYKAGYTSAKHAILGLIKVAALEGAPHGLCANVIAPGLMWTALMENQLQDHMRLRGWTRQQVLDRIDLFQPGRAVTVTESAEVVAFLASARASGVSGTCIPVDLGAVAA